ncbi:MAG: MaoC family dehydratase N-terminal domain-containing protein [Propionibacteriaceae bacterium]|nr:MaoC family dehydratase N-terminal domain-containing protein [Propionibacteriaceae bacterium]
MEASLLDEMGWVPYIGSKYAPHTGEPVTARDIRRYALAIDDINPIFFDREAAKKGKYGGLAAPLNYFSWSVGVPGAEKPTSELGEDGLSSFVGVPEIPNAFDLGWMRGGEEIEHFKPVYEGDCVTVTGEVVDMKEKHGKSGTLIFVTSVFEYRNQDGDLLVKHTVTMIATPRKD